ncbi:MAG: hypothetical protein Q9168_004370, partial [Polycauliona sp. 1 TL-2023]
MAYPPITHGCSAYPTPMHSARFSNRWSRHSQLSNEDWREGGMGTPLVRPDDFDLPLPPTTLDNDFSTALPPSPTSRKSFRQSVRNSWRSSFMGSGRGGGSSKHRWSILSASSPSPSSIPLDPYPSSSADAAPTPAQPTPMLRKRKRWSNAIGSTTTTFVGNIGSSWGSSLAPSSSGGYEEAEAGPQ